MYYVGQVLYYELNIDYIIETYCINKDKPELECNGKCHLATQIQKASNDSGKGKSHQMVFEAFYPVFVQQIANEEITPSQLMFFKAKQPIYYVNNYSHLIDYSIYKPPIC
ncbi:hypothetical protein DMZ43_09185 [Meridianimaribacter sp. CL38]|uniref:hypothetical protein n=1 Tax=Meridianimaribacter sp. CL38 TaxID=2213021 RepID=UPI001039C0A5|nr:hypothetical protein [Meridianimaribacter sp. CL38]TBV26068.1 hypothetical protein DMZ43_09185 [Meridianimaribacter sp. CL38]